MMGRLKENYFTIYLFELLATPIFNLVTFLVNGEDTDYYHFLHWFSSVLYTWANLI